MKRFHLLLLSAFVLTLLLCSCSDTASPSAAPERSSGSASTDFAGSAVRSKETYGNTPAPDMDDAAFR